MKTTEEGVKMTAPTLREALGVESAGGTVEIGRRAVSGSLCPVALEKVTSTLTPMAGQHRPELRPPLLEFGVLQGLGRPLSHLSDHIYTAPWDDKYEDVLQIRCWKTQMEDLILSCEQLQDE